MRHSMSRFLLWSMERWIWILRYNRLIRRNIQEALLFIHPKWKAGLNKLSERRFMHRKQVRAMRAHRLWSAGMKIPLRASEWGRLQRFTNGTFTSVRTGFRSLLKMHHLPSIESHRDVHQWLWWIFRWDTVLKRILFYLASHRKFYPSPFNEIFDHFYFENIFQNKV